MAEKVANSKKSKREIISISPKVTYSLKKGFNRLRLDPAIYRLVHGTLRELISLKNYSPDDIVSCRLVSNKGDGFLLHIKYVLQHVYTLHEKGLARS